MLFNNHRSHKAQRFNIGSTRITFHRFCRRGYAAFASIHREVSIGILTVATLASVNLPKVQASNVTLSSSDTRVTTPEGSPEGIIDEHDLSTVSVTGTLSPLATLQSARIVNTITSQQIQAAAVQTINDILKLAVGVDVRQRGGFGIQTDISIDGGTFDQITILLNGVNITSPHTGHLAADFPVTLSDIERIEILEGAASRVYGASAFGGAINIVTKSPHQSYKAKLSNKSGKLLTLDAGAHGGSYATFGGDARLAISKASTSLAEGVWCGSLSATYQRSDGATVNSDFSRGNAYLRSVYDASDFTIDLQAGYSQKSYGANTFYSAAYPNQYERNTRIITSLGAETKGRLRLRPEIFWNRLYDNFELIRNTTTGENFHRSDVHGARLTASLAWLAGRTSIGAEVREEGIYSTSLGHTLTNPKHSAPLHSAPMHSAPMHSAPLHSAPLHSAPMRLAPMRLAAGGLPAGTSYTHHDSRTNLSFNVEHTVLLSQFTLSAGLLANMNTRFDSHLQFYPGVDMSYRPSSSWRIFASYNKGFRLPTFTDLYYKSPTHEGNQGMRAEESHSFQLGFQNNYQLSTVNYQLQAKAFYHRGTNMIDWVMYSADDVFHSANFNLDNTGFSTHVNCQMSNVNCQVSYAFIHQHRRDASPIYKSNYAMEYLRHKIVASLDHPIFVRKAPTNSGKPRNKALTACWTLRWQDRMGSYILYTDAKSTGQLVPYKPYATLDLKIRWSEPHYELWVEGTNLTNHRYYDLGNIPQPGLIILAGARVLL